MRASKTEMLSTASITASLDEKIIASLLWKISARKLAKRLIRKDIAVDTIVANLAPFPLAAPSSLATLTLVNNKEGTVFNFLRQVLLDSITTVMSFSCLPSAF